MIDYALPHLGIEEFIIRCAVNNRASRAIPERPGYQLQETIPNGEVIGENIYDGVVYGIRS